MWNRCLDYFEHACIRYVWAVCRYEIFALPLDLEEVPKWGFETDVVERRHFLSVGHFARIKDRPFCQLCDTVGSLFVL